MSSLLNVEASFDLDKNQYNYEKDLLIIAGPTCVGKSSVAMKLAKKINGVLINADSVQVYKDLKLLSARPSEEDMQQIPHFLYAYVKSQKNYSIADIATFPWIARHEWHDIGLKKFKGLTRWYEEISKREAVQRGYDLLKKGEKIPKV